MDMSSFIQYLSQRQILNYSFLSSTALFIYDYILTLHIEIKFIWFSPWTYTKVLYLLIRYLTFIDTMLYTVEQTFLNVPIEVCRVIYPMSTWFMAVQIFLAEGVLCIRTWAIWRRNKVIGIVLTIVMATFLVVQSILVNRYVKSMEYPPIPYSQFRGCFVKKAPSDLWANFVLITIVDIIVLVPMVVSAWRSYQGGASSGLSNIVHRDGILFYIYLLCFSVVNLTITIAWPIDISPVLTSLQNTLYAVLTTRIVLNIREEVGNSGLQTELHTNHGSTPVLALPLRQICGRDDIDWSRSWIPEP